MQKRREQPFIARKESRYARLFVAIGRQIPLTIQRLAKSSDACAYASVVAVGEMLGWMGVLVGVKCARSLYVCPVAVPGDIGQEPRLGAALVASSCVEG